MIPQVVAVSVVAYAVSLLKFRKCQLLQKLVFLYIFIVGVTFLGKLDVLLPIYFFVSTCPFITKVRKISKITLFICAWFGIYLVFGLIFQDPVATITSFVAKYWQIIIFFIVIDTPLKSKTIVTYNQLQVSLLIETILAIYLLLTNSKVEENGLVRLVSNAQPITGNIAITVLPISVYLYFKYKNDSKIETKIIFTEMIFFVWIVLSGTRGYTLMFAGTMFIVFYDYWICNQKNKPKAYNRFAIIFLMGFAALVFIVVTPEILNRIISILRLEDSTGIRSYENAAEWEFFLNAPWNVKIFGIGLGGTAGTYNAFSSAILKQVSRGMWNKNSYLYGSGAPFHNLFANLLLNLGVIGVIVVIIAEVYIWNIIFRVCKKNSKIKWIFHLYQISFLLMNYFRWSASCGIAETIAFSLTLKLLAKEPTVTEEKNLN